MPDTFSDTCKCPHQGCGREIYVNFVRIMGKCPACNKPLTVDELLAVKLSVDQPAAVAEPAQNTQL